MEANIRVMGIVKDSSILDCELTLENRSIDVKDDEFAVHKAVAVVEGFLLYLL